MKRSGLSSLLVLGFFSACVESSDETGGESNWVECAVDEDCRGDQRCHAERCVPPEQDGAVASGASVEPSASLTEDEEVTTEGVAVTLGDETTLARNDESSVEGSGAANSEVDASSDEDPGSAPAASQGSEDLSTSSSDTNNGEATGSDGIAESSSAGDTTNGDNTQAAGGTDAGSEPGSDLFTVTVSAGPNSQDLRALVLAGETLYAASTTELWSRTDGVWSSEALPQEWSGDILNLALTSEGQLVLAGGEPGGVFSRAANGWVGANYDECEFPHGMKLAPGPDGVIFLICSDLLQIDGMGIRVVPTPSSPSDLIYIEQGPRQGLHVLLPNQVVSHADIPFGAVEGAPSGTLRDLPTDPERPFFSFNILGALSDGALLALGGSGLIVGDQGGDFVWEATSMSAPSGTLIDVAAAGDIAIAVGSMGLLMIRQDTQWSTLAPPTPGALYAVRVSADASYFVAVGAGGVVVEGRR